MWYNFKYKLSESSWIDVTLGVLILSTSVLFLSVAATLVYDVFVNTPARIAGS